MNTVTVKAYAKLNIALNVLGVSEGFHMLDMIATTVNKYDEVKVTKRKDNKILISFVGKYGFIPSKQEDTNAYKAVEAFMQEFKTNGANVEIIRNIPTGSGMGGSSADIVGTLKALKKLYSVKGSIEPIATKLGSDCTYLLKGGFARLTGRGEKVESFNVPNKLYFVAIYSNVVVTAKDSFLNFDALCKKGNVCNIDAVKTALEKGDLDALKQCSENGEFNALTKASISLNGEIQANLQSLKDLCPPFYAMSGSGSTVFAVYDSVEMAKWAYSKLVGRYGNNVELLTSHNLNELSIFDVIFNKDYYLAEI